MLSKLPPIEIGEEKTEMALVLESTLIRFKIKSKESRVNRTWSSTPPFLSQISITFSLTETSNSFGVV